MNKGKREKVQEECDLFLWGEKEIHRRRSDATDQHKQIGSFFDQGLLGVVSLQSRSSLLV